MINHDGRIAGCDGQIGQGKSEYLLRAAANPMGAVADGLPDHDADENRDQPNFQCDDCDRGINGASAEGRNCAIQPGAQ